MSEKGIGDFVNTVTEENLYPVLRVYVFRSTLKVNRPFSTLMKRTKIIILFTENRQDILSFPFFLSFFWTRTDTWLNFKKHMDQRIDTKKPAYLIILYSWNSIRNIVCHFTDTYTAGCKYSEEELL